MPDLVQLSEMQVDSVAGGRIGVGSISVQTNINVNPQVALGLAVLSPHALVSASNLSYTSQLNVAIPVL
jgi:hypothetical protein